MDSGKTIAEYLVRIGADIDSGSFYAVSGLLKQLEVRLKALRKFAAPAAIISGIAAISKATVSMIRDVARADMEFQKLATHMWITKESAKALSTAMKVMGVSQEDIAWVPELRKQFFRLRAEMNSFATPADADQQLKWIRGIGYDIQALQVRLRMLREWIVYYLIKYMGPFIKELQDFINWLSKKIGDDMPGIARTVAKVLATVVSIGASALKVVASLVGTIYDFVTSLPANVKRWAAIFAAVGAAIMAGPFGLMIAAIGGALVLLQDFIYYQNGLRSSKTLAPMWEKLLQFLEGDTLTTIVGKVRKVLKEVADGLDYIVKTLTANIDWAGIKKTWSEALDDLKDGVKALFDVVSDLFDKIFEGTGDKEKGRQKTFWRAIAAVISEAVKRMGELAGAVGKLMAAVALALRGDFVGAAKMLGVAILQGSGASRILGAIAGSADQKVNIQSALGGLQQGGLSRDGAAGVIGNLLEESGMIANRVEGDYGFSDPEKRRRDYTAWAKQNPERFFNDGIGYGLAQWTSPERKRGLWEYTGGDIDNFGLQLAYLLKELRDDYPELYARLQNATDAGEAARLVMTQYERPADQSWSKQVDRSNSAQSVLDMTPMAGFMSASGVPGPSFADIFSGGAGAPSMVSYGYPTTVNNGGSFSVGNINISVGGTNATPQEIWRALDQGLNARFGKGVFA